MDEGRRVPALHAVTLRFLDPELEAAYQAAAREDAILPFRVANVLAIAVFVLVAIVSIAVAPVPAVLSLPGCAVMIAVVLAALVAGPQTRTLDQLQVVGGMENAAAGIVAVAVPYLGGALERFGAEAVGFAVLWAFVVLRLRFVAAALSVATYVAVFTVLELAGPREGVGVVLVPLYSSVLALAAAAYLLERSLRRQFFDRLVIDRQRVEIADEKAKSDRLLLNILPAPIANRLRNGETSIADGFAEASVLFADIVGFTPLAESLPVERTVAFLDELFSSFDVLCQRRGLEKVKTIGDAYMAVAGVPVPAADHAARTVGLGLDMLAAAAEMRERTGLPLHIRVGVNSGRVIAGVIGKLKFSYDLWGDTVNTASRLESTGVVDRIQLSAATRAMLGDRFPLESRGEIEVKGKGRLQAWLVVAGDARPGSTEGADAAQLHASSSGAVRQR